MSQKHIKCKLERECWRFMRQWQASTHVSDSSGISMSHNPVDSLINQSNLFSEPYSRRYLQQVMSPVTVTETVVRRTL